MKRLPFALLWIAGVAGNGLLNNLLKELFHRARPVHEHALSVSSTVWSFPSGHSSGSVIAFGLLGYLLLKVVPSESKLLVLLAAGGTVYSVGLSRIFLQVHYASDFIAGFTAGSLWLTFIIFAFELTRSHMVERKKH